MFTGIVEEVGAVKVNGSGYLVVSAKEVLKGSRLGDSIAVNGVCLTVNSIDEDSFSVDIMPETSRLTNLGRLHFGDAVNLERAMQIGGRIGGHLVQGHIDDTGKVLSLKPEGEAVIVRISAPSALMPYIVHKGFIAVDGVSLTVVSLDDYSFSVSLVSFTRQHTTLGEMKPGSTVNLEVDIIAKYVERLKQQNSKGVTLDFLEEQGFLKVR